MRVFDEMTSDQIAALPPEQIPIASAILEKEYALMENRRVAALLQQRVPVTRDNINVIVANAFINRFRTGCPDRFSPADLRREQKCFRPLKSKGQGVRHAPPTSF